LKKKHLRLLIFAALIVFSAAHFIQHRLSPKPKADFPPSELQLPAVHLWFDEIKANSKRPAWIAIDSQHPGEILKPKPISIRYSGNTATKLPKKRFTFQIADKDDWTEPSDRSILGMKENDDWILDAAFRDGLLFRNRLSFEIYNSLGHFKGVASRFVDVFVNNEYQGVYVLSEEYNRKNLGLEKSSISTPLHDHFQRFSERLIPIELKRLYAKLAVWSLKFENSKSLAPASEALFKVTRSSADFTTESKRRYEQRFPKPHHHSAEPLIDKVISFVSQSSDPEFSSQVWRIFQKESTIDYLCFLILTAAYDNVRSNYFLVYKNDLFYFAPWDLDNTFRSLDYKTGKIMASHTQWPYETNLLFKRLMTLKKSEIQNRWFELRKNQFSLQKILNLVQSEYDQLAKTGSYVKDNNRWNKPQTSQSNELGLLNEWIRQRLKFADEKIQSL
jgi:hypothetical protein